MIDVASAQKLKALRRDAGRTQAEMAKLLGLSLNTYAIMETTGRMGTETRKRVRRYLRRRQPASEMIAAL